MQRPVLHWFTSDLRLTDNAALASADADAPRAGVFVFDPLSLRRAGEAPRRRTFLDACLGALDDSLRAQGSRLIVCDGDPAVEIPAVAAALDATVVTHAANQEPGARRREERVAQALRSAGIEVRAADAASVHACGSVRTGAGGPYLVYGAFARAWSTRAPRPACRAPRRWLPQPELASVGRALTPLRPAARDALPPAGEAAARARLTEFVREALPTYAERRDFPGMDATSRLSYHLRFGTISASEAVRRACTAAAHDPAARRGADTWMRELAWRDFFAQLLAAFPRLVREPFRPLPIQWRIDDHGFRCWQEGRTGYPLVDAGMRELAATGWMHNRARMVTASFLVRHLLLDWRAGERHFMDLLLDGQLAQNDGNWQWVAGTGADAHPYRIFSPVRQAERFDPDGFYVLRWVPELQRVPRRHLHAPWKLLPLERRALCPQYPPPVVDPDEAPARARAALAEATARRRQ